MRTKIVAGNWKMNLNPTEGQKLIQDILTLLPTLHADKQVVIAPPFIQIMQAAEQVKNTAHVSVAGQNCHQETFGAYTGEVAAAMLQAAGAEWVILGHSERREYFQETDALLAQKTNAALAAGLKVIFCCGEPLAVRDADTQNSYVENQISAGLFHYSAAQLADIVVAYEPIWAIGTGRTATAQQAQDMHAHIRSIIRTQYGTDAANRLSILYGGSCKPSNAPELFACPDVDGGLIGGAALKAEDFIGIINALMKH
jgi:triosephosphate isomerase